MFHTSREDVIGSVFVDLRVDLQYLSFQVGSHVSSQSSIAGELQQRSVCSGERRRPRGHDTACAHGYGPQNVARQILLESGYARIESQLSQKSPASPAIEHATHHPWSRHGPDLPLYQSRPRGPPIGR